MSQHDYVIANQTGAAFRSDLNDALAAIVTANSGAAEPTTTYKFQWWADETNDLLKIRNAANTAWITVGTLSAARLGLAIAGLATASGLTVSGAGKVLGRTTSGAGAVEELTVGTAASNLVQLTAAAKLPAVDGSLLTGIMDSVSRDQIALTNMRLMLNSAVTTGVLVQGKQWELGSDEWSSGSSGYGYNAGSPAYYDRAPGSFVQISQGAGTAIGNATDRGGLAAAFDGNLAQGYPSGGCVHEYNATATIGKDWGAGVTKTVTKFVAYAPNNYSDFRCGGGSCTIKLQGSSDGSAWTDLYSGTTGQPGSGNALTVGSGITTSAAYRYHRLEFGTAGGGAFVTAEVQFFETSAPTDATLVSPVVTLSSAPTYADLFCLYKDNSGTAVLGTDFTVDLSRDGGTTWTTATLTNQTGAAGFDGTYAQIKARADLSAQPSGTSLKARVKILNKSQQFAAPALYAE